MKVIFLDIDGVMNDENSWGDHSDNSDNPTIKHLQRLQTICEKTGAVVVLSSSWRVSNYGIRTLLELFYNYDIPMFSITREGVEEESLEAANIKVTSKHKYVSSWNQNKTIITDRGAEIAIWLHEHYYKVDSYVIIDDEIEDITPYFTDSVILKTNMKLGLTDVDMNKAIEILGEI